MEKGSRRPGIRKAVEYISGEFLGMIKGVKDIKSIQTLAPEYLVKIKEITKTNHQDINCHGTSAYLAGLINTPRGIEAEELSKLLEAIKPNEHLTPNSLICHRTEEGGITHSGILINNTGTDYILHKRGYDSLIEIVPLAGVFPSTIKIQSYSQATQK